MKVNSFNDVAEVVNRAFLSRMFGIPPNKSHASSRRSTYGIDLVDHEKRVGIELKGAVAKNGIAMHDYWFKIGVNQIYDYPKDLPGYHLFWAFMGFEITVPIEMLQPALVAAAICRREVLIYDWDYIHCFTAFDDQIRAANGCSVAVPIHDVLGVPNPYRQTPGRKKEDPHPQLPMVIEEKPFCKKFIKIPRNELDTHRMNFFYTGERINIVASTDRCAPLLQYFGSGLYDSRFADRDEPYCPMHTHMALKVNPELRPA